MPEIPPVPGVPSGPPPVPPQSNPPVPPVYPSGPPPVSYPPVVPPQTAPGSGTRSLLYGCLGLLAVAGIVVVIGSIWAFKKVKAIAADPEQFIAEMAVKANPDLELVKVDKVAREIVIKDKKSGESTTFSFDEVKDGKLTMKHSDGSSAEVGAGGVKSWDKDGNETVIGAGTVMPLPDWVPAWQGAHQVMLSSRKTAGGQVTGTFTFSVSADVDEAAVTYQKQLEAAGFAVETETVAAPAGKVVNLTAQGGAAGAERLLKVNCLSQDTTGTIVTLQYEGASR
jgi:hypothetical protein